MCLISTLIEQENGGQLDGNILAVCTGTLPLEFSAQGFGQW